MADDVKSEPRLALPEGIARDLLVALGWAAFVGVGIAIGLTLGALGSDVGADAQMILIAGVIAGLGTFVVRLLMVAIRRGFGSNAGSPAPRSEATKPAPDENEAEAGKKPPARPAKRSPAKRSPAKKSSGGAKKTNQKTKKSPAKKSGARKTSGARKKSPTKKASGAKKKPAPRKRSGGS